MSLGIGCGGRGCSPHRTPSWLLLAPAPAEAPAVPRMPGAPGTADRPPPGPPIRGHSLGCGASGPRWGHLQARAWTSALSPRTLDLSRVPARAGWGRPLLPCPAVRRCVTVTEDVSLRVSAVFPRLSCVVGAGAHGRAGGPRSAQPLAPAPLQPGCPTRISTSPGSSPGSLVLAPRTGSAEPVGRSVWLARVCHGLCHLRSHRGTQEGRSLRGSVSETATRTTPAAGLGRETVRARGAQGTAALCSPV